MYGVRGRRHLAQSETGGRRRGSEPAAGSRRDGAGAEDGPQPVDVEKLLDLRVTDVIDPASFWAQVGEAKALAEFDSGMASLSKWCNQWGEPASLLPKVGEVIAVKGAETGQWVRAKVSRQVSVSDVEVFYIDTGSTGRVSLDSVCGGSAPQLYSLPKQAFQCSLHGIQPTGGSEVWTESSIARFSELVGGVLTKAKLLNMAGQDHNCTILLYVRRGEEWVGVTELLVGEGLAQQAAADDSAPELIPASTPSAEGEGDEDEEGEEEGKCDSSFGLNLSVDVEEEVEEGGSSGPVTTCSAEEGEGGQGQGEGRDSISPEASDEDEWDESLLQPLRGLLSSSHDSTPSRVARDPFGPPPPDPTVQRRQRSLQEQYKAIVGASEVDGDRGGEKDGKQFNESQRTFGSFVGRGVGRGRGGGGGGWGGRKGGKYHRGGWSGHARREGEEWRGGGGREEGGEFRGRRDEGYKSAGWQGHSPRGGRGRHNQRPELDQSRAGEERQLGGMRGVKVTTKPPHSNSGAIVPEVQKQVASPAKDGSHSSITPPPAPPSTMPVELFLRESGVGSRVRETGGESQGPSAFPAMSAEMAKKEIQWHRWKLESEIKKIMKTLTEENLESFGTDVQNILSTHSSAMKLMSLPGSRGPVWPALSCLLAEGVRRKDGAEKTIVVALRKLAGVLSVDVCQLLQPVVEEMAIDLCEQPSSSEQSIRSKRLFCCFVGKLFLDASYTRNRDYAAVMGRIVRHFLNTWSKCPVDAREEQLMSEVQCFSFLCQQIGPTIDVTNKETLEQYFTGVVENNILNTKLPRSVCRFLLRLSVKRAAGWREEDAIGSAEVSPPSAFSQDTPTHSANGQRVVQPVPVEGTRTENGTTPQNGTWNRSMPENTSASGPSYPQSLGYSPHSLPQTTVPPQPLPPETTLPRHLPPPGTTVPPHLPPQGTTVPHLPPPGTTVPPQPPPQFQTNYTSRHQSVTPGHGVPTQLYYPQHSIAQGTPSGVQPFQNTPPSHSYSAVQEMLQALGLSHYLDSFKRAIMSDTVMECGNTDTLSGGLKAVGLQPGEVISVLTYLEKRRCGQTPSSPYAPQQFTSLPYATEYNNSPRTPVTPRHFTLPTTPTSAPSAMQHSQQYPHPTNHPPTPTFSPSPHHHSAQPSPLSQFTPAYPAPTRLPNPTLTYPHQEHTPFSTVSTPGGGSTTPVANQKYGFGQFSCVLCCSSDHRTEQCPDRNQLFLQSRNHIL